MTRVHQETVRELQALRQTYAEDKNQCEAARRALEAAASVRENAFGRIEREFDRSLALMNENIAHLESIADIAKPDHRRPGPCHPAPGKPAVFQARGIVDDLPFEKTGITSPRIFLFHGERAEMTPGLRPKTSMVIKKR